jgi:hypothetical protein
VASYALAAVAGLITRGLDKGSDAEIANALRTLGERFKPQLRFVLMAETQLRRLAGRREEFEWLIRALEWIKQQAPDDGTSSP